jgi:hypothetical protein
MLLFGIGCGKDAPAPKENNTEQTAKSPASSQEAAFPGNAQASNSKDGSTSPKPVSIKPLSLGSLGGNKNTKANGTTSTDAGESQMDSVVEALQPFQVFLGQWNTTTKSMGAGKANWVWDFKTDKSQPALVMSTKDHPYFETARLTFLTDKQKFQLTAQDKEKQKRTYEGEFTEQPHEVTGDTGKPEPQFEMMLSEVGNTEARKLVGVKLTLREKNRMWMEVFQKSGKTIRPQDNVASQREGTSFAVSDTDYGDKECIVSQGLGVTEVTYMGRTYYVCCSGCQSAFNDDPTFWINKAEERKKTEEK